MVDATDTDDDGEEVAEKDVEVQIGSLNPTFNLVMEIYPSYHKGKLEFGLWNNRPNTSDEAVDRSILL